MKKTSLVFILLLSFQVISVTAQYSLNPQAQVEARKFFRKMYTKCGGYYYYQYNKRMNFLYQCKYAPRITINGKTLRPRRLSEADRLNGVDPLPIAWNGYATINLSLCRKQAFYANRKPGYNAWGRWSDTNKDSVRFWKKKGNWEFYNKPRGRELGAFKTIQPLTCDDIPSANKKTPVRMPSWEKNSFQGSILTIPANYGKWIYIGKGPMNVKKYNPYTSIFIDGTNNRYYPDGGSYYVGGKKTSKRALSPNTLLGSVIAKIGENGQPFPLFRQYDTRGSLNGYTIKTNEKVFVAINDSYFDDNRGEHKLAIKGNNLCVNCTQNSNQNLPSNVSAMRNGSYIKNVPLPSKSIVNYKWRNNLFSFSVPRNWISFFNQNSVFFAPKGAYGKDGITHGILIGVNKTIYITKNATKKLVGGFLKSSKHFRRITDYSKIKINGKIGYTTTLSGKSPTTGNIENVFIYITLLRNGSLFYIACVVPQNETDRYKQTFEKVISLIRIKG